MRYFVVLEESHNGVGAYAPNLPGCVAFGDDREHAIRLIRQAIGLHLEGLRDAATSDMGLETQFEVVDIEGT